MSGFFFQRRQVVATHVPAVGLDVPVGVRTKDHLDTQVYAYKSSPKTDLPRKDQTAFGTGNSRGIKDKKVRIVLCRLHVRLTSFVSEFFVWFDLLQVFFSTKQFNIWSFYCYSFFYCHIISVHLKLPAQAIFVLITVHNTLPQFDCFLC